ncbi:hypothetical protein CIAN88_01510 [[Clostridium] innocuum]|uniref:Uncharacterized protein n=1 Tax=Clostridium innocuum TaxID=1522 RepID=A0A099IA12_CLOIN|nr:hypothetical protein CIAN88_01510 [[Clostridium] innocuum]
MSRFHSWPIIFTGPMTSFFFYRISNATGFVMRLAESTAKRMEKQKVYLIYNLTEVRMKANRRGYHQPVSVYL